ncbi:hypothetical protein M3194_30685 [Paenibacillus glycanilyticus]|uniref:hypothetical protein n=1 Tax=Paenibacillus glycanilyticus TaxID=126569 RepID=UPI00203F6C6F|nr:hypothetical protein [Paenibacillus glycanilyticus]MCM3631661.1 hypothetical protein [Paenibacillus glycanilyticus]
MTQADVTQMLVRKLVAAYFTSWAISLWLSFPNIVFRGANWNAADYLLSVQVIALYASPVIFIYGVLVSSILEAIAVRLKVKGLIAVLVSGLLHVTFGHCFGLLIHSPQLSLIGGVASFLFFSLDLLIVRYILSLRLKTGLIFFALPIFSLLLIAGTINAISPPSPPMPPFTADDALHFATAGKGTSIDVFPKEEGKVKLKIENYYIERETKVEKSSRKDTYNVVFTERWRKGEENGQYQMVYEVSRGSMELKRSTRPKPPYL